MSHLHKYDNVSFYGPNSQEAYFLYNEIFQEGCYDISDLPEDPFVVDAGANLGLFSLYVKQKFPTARVLAFEPAPDTFNNLNRNLKLNNCADGVSTFQCGLASKASVEKLTFFPNLPSNSTLFPNEKEELYEVAVKKRGKEVADEVFGGAQQVEVKLERLSRFLSNVEQLKAIDLLKVDVEGAELEVLRGLDDEHWALVRRAVLEVWQGSGLTTEIEELLQSKGFRVHREESGFSTSTFYVISAHRE